MTTPHEAVFGDDLGGVGKQAAGEAIPNIGDMSGDAVAQATQGASEATADGEPVSPYVAARRYGADAGYGSRRGST